MTEAEILERLKGDFRSELEKGLLKNSERLDQLAKQIEERQTALMKTLEEVRAKYAAFELPGSDEAKHKGQKYSFQRVFAAVQSGDPSLAPMEHEMSKAVRAKAMSFGSDAAGGFLVPNDVLRSELVELLYADSIVLQLGARQLTGLTKGQVNIPKVTGGTTAYWLGENTSITASDAALAMLTLNPHPLFALSVASDLLLTLDSGAEEMLRQDMMAQIALKIDKAALKGIGASGEPQGVIGTTNIGTSTLSTPPTYNELMAFISTVRGNNALKGKIGWAINNTDLASLEQINDLLGASTNSPVQVYDRRRLFNEAGDRLLGFPYKLSTQLAVTELIFGNWADVIIAQWGGMKVDMSNAPGFTSGQTHIRVTTYQDVAVRHEKSFCVKA